MRSIPTTIKAQLHTTIAFIFLLYVAPALSSSFDVLQEAPFPSDIFTQGFEKADGKFYLSSGGYRSSFISVVDNKGHELIRKKLSKRFFSEGLTIKDGKIYVLTWKKGILLVLDKNSLELQNALHYSGEGWGLTQTTEHFLMSNGSDIIQLKDFQSFKTLAELNVTNNGSPVQKLNELEFAEGLIWANAWHDDHIYAIDPATGKVIQKWNSGEEPTRMYSRRVSIITPRSMART